MDLINYIPQLSKKYHEIKMSNDLKQGYHPPDECNVRTLIVNAPDQAYIDSILAKLKFENRCPKCGKDLYPYEELNSTLTTPIKTIVSDILLTVSLLESTTCKNCTHWGDSLCSVDDPAVSMDGESAICSGFDWNLTATCNNCFYWKNSLCYVSDPAVTKDGESETCTSFKWMVIAKCKDCGYWSENMCSVNDPAVEKTGESDICASFAWTAPEV